MMDGDAVLKRRKDIRRNEEWNYFPTVRSAFKCVFVTFEL
jgi:hypothetical protein